MTPRQLPPENLDAVADRVEAHPGELIWSWVAVRRPPNVDLFALSLRSEGPLDERIYDYERLTITREVLAARAAADRLRARVAGTVDIDGQRVEVGLGTQLAASSGYMLPTGERFGIGPTPEWPTYYLEWPLAPTNELIWAAQLDQPLTRRGQPPYERAEVAVLELLYGMQVERPGMQRASSSLVFRLADRRARIREPSISGHELIFPVDVTADSSEVFVLQVAWTAEGKERETLEQPIASSDVVRIPLANDHVPEYFAALLDRSGEWCDERRLPSSSRICLPPTRGCR